LVAEVMKGAAAMSANTTTTGTKMVQWDVESAAGTSIAIVAFSMADIEGEKKSTGTIDTIKSEARSDEKKYRGRDAPACAMAAMSPSSLIEKLALARLDTAIEQFRAADKHLDALECMERALVLRQRLFGLQSEEVRARARRRRRRRQRPASPARPNALPRASPSRQFWAPARRAGELCNQLALSFMQKEDYAQVDKLLRRAEALTQRDPAGRAVTYNNWACYMRQVGNLHSALASLRRALALEQRLAKVASPADTHINLCSVLSQLHKHDEALEHARTALSLIDAEVMGTAAAKRVMAAPSGGGLKAAMALSPPDRLAVLCIAYHNLGVESEFLKEYTAALKAYTKGAEIAADFLGEAHGITAMIKASQVAAAKAVAAERKRQKAEEAAKAAAEAAAADERAKAAAEASRAAAAKA
jgi:tetratricopeptide (TPR) repeat protein